jgi:hypothetical protein
VLLSSPFLTRVKMLDFSGCSLTDDAVQSLVNSPVAGQLEALALGYWTETNLVPEPVNPVFTPTDRQVATLAGARNLSGLRELRLPGDHLTDAAIDSLIHSPQLTKLEWLNLSGTTSTVPLPSISPAAIQRLQERFRSAQVITVKDSYEPRTSPRGLRW